MIGCPDCQRRHEQASKGAHIANKRMQGTAMAQERAKVAIAARWSKSAKARAAKAKAKRDRVLDDWYNGRREW